jgi:hypothetical protein
MSLLGRIGRGLGTALLTGSPAGTVAAFATNSLGVGVGTGIVDNLTYGGVTNAWSGNYGYGGFYGADYSGGYYAGYQQGMYDSYNSGAGYWGW